ncbi:4Fe-4S dicluster domain-containing protein [Desulfobotulus mexicanus]|uniref:4Fe-4S dicluster domain-containing protein n=2 Tax=Desulfobacteraceae TaxID=213119 RepID=A0A5Q4VD53_9BACT|nr:4Fe-4S dicluster domain-containing protein [Desulfobotulus mexicanus]
MVSTMQVDRSFIREVEERSGQRFGACFHCMACSGGCPVSDIMDYLPNQIVRMMQLGLRKEVLESRAIWVCVGCYSCVSQCPNRIHIPYMMDALRELALEEGVKIGEPDIWTFHREFLKQVDKRGRVYELEFMARYKLSTMSLFSDMGSGMKMLLNGRLELFPHTVKKLHEVRKIREVCYGKK